MMNNGSEAVRQRTERSEGRWWNHYLSGARSISNLVGSRYDLDKAAVSSDLLRAWLAIVAFGLSAEAKRDDLKEMRMQFGRALDYPVTFAFSGTFAEKHAGLARALRSVAACPGKWKEAAANGTAEFVIDGLT